MSSSPTCKLCGETVTGISQTGDTVRFEPCGHSVPEDAKKHWLKKESEAVEDTYVPEDVAARNSVDRDEVRAHLVNAPTREQLAAAAHRYFCVKSNEPTHQPDDADYDKAEEILEILALVERT